VKVVTFPIGVRSKVVKEGLTLTPLISNLIAKHKDLDSILAINILDSYKVDRKKYLKSYLDTLESQNINFDTIWLDDNPYDMDVILNNIKNLYKIGLISTQTKKVNVCKCGRVEYLNSDYLHKGARLYTLINNKVICKKCKSETVAIEKKVLTMNFPRHIQQPLSVSPKNMVKEVAEIMNRISGMEYMVSRVRDTGVYIELDENRYNIDIDFYWLNLLSCFNDKEFIVVGSNHVTWHLCLIHALNAINKKNTNIVLTPYIYNKDDILIENHIKHNSVNFKLALLSHLSWKKGFSNWESKLLDKINRLEEYEVEYIIKNILNNEYENFNICEKINKNLVLREIKNAKSK